MPESGSCGRLLIFVVAYEAEHFIENVLQRIPPELGQKYDVEILVIDDASVDRTFEHAVAARIKGDSPLRIQVLTNPVNQGYGGNQKIGYWYAIENDFDYVALVHGDGQYAPECLPALLEPLDEGQADAVFGSRMLSPEGALGGGMPPYKYVGNRILTFIQSVLLNASLSEFHSGYRIYSVGALRRIPFDLNTNDFHFDTEIIIQLLIAGQRIAELPIPTYYGDEICHVNGVKYACNVLLTTLKARVQGLGLYYDRKYDCSERASLNQHYRPKLGFRSPHSLALEPIEPNSRVLDLGCAGGYLGKALKELKGCFVTGVDVLPLANVELDGFILHDLDEGPPNIDLTQYDYILLLDVVEHLRSPEHFVARLREATAPEARVIVSTANVGFFITRLSLLLGHFNYGKRGVLDLTHLRLFTFAAIKALFKQANYDVLYVTGTPIPFPLVLGNTRISKLLLAINSLLLSVHRYLFSFQSFLVVQPRPTLSHLFRAARREADSRLQTQSWNHDSRLPLNQPEGNTS